MKFSVNMSEVKVWAAVGAIAIIVIIGSSITGIRKDVERERTNAKYTEVQDAKLNTAVYTAYAYCTELREHAGITYNDQKMLVNSKQYCLFDLINKFGLERIDKAVDIEKLSKDFTKEDEK